MRIIQFNDYNTKLPRMIKVSLNFSSIIMIYFFILIPIGNSSSLEKTKQLKFQTSLRVDMVYQDHKTEETDSFSPDSSTKIKVGNLKFQFKGNLDSKTNYRLRIDAKNMDKKNEVLEYGYIKWKLNNHLKLLIGQFKVAQGGIEEDLSGLYRPYGSFKKNGYKQKYAPMISTEINIEQIGFLAIQVLNDQTSLSKINKDVKSTEKKSKQLTYAIQYSGKFGLLKPLFQYGTLDNQQSNWISIGSKFKFDSMNFYINYSELNISEKDEDKKREVSKHTSIESEVNYKLTPSLSPYFFYSKYEVKQAFNDLNVNPKLGKYKDNGQNYTVGINIKKNEILTLYANISIRKGKFYEDLKKDKQDTMIKKENIFKMGIIVKS